MKIASDMESTSTLSELTFLADKLLAQRLCPAERPCIDIGKTQHSTAANLLADRLRSNRKTPGAEFSRLVFGIV